MSGFPVAKPPVTSMPDPIEISAVTLAVRDLDRVVRFYADVIGIEPIETGPDAVWLGVAGRKLLRLLHRPDFLPVDPQAAGLFHIAFLLPTRADLGRWLRHAAALGVDLAGAADHLVSEAVYLADPEGNGIEIYADRPRTAWTWEAGSQIVMANNRLDLAALRAIDAEPWTGAPPGTRIGHVHLQVGDLDVAAPFYTGLGLVVTRRWPQAIFLSTGGYHHQVALNTWRSAGAGQRNAHRAGLAGVTLRTQPPSAASADPWGTAIDTTTGDYA